MPHAASLPCLSRYAAADAPPPQGHLRTNPPRPLPCSGFDGRILNKYGFKTESFGMVKVRRLHQHARAWVTDTLALGAQSHVRQPPHTLHPCGGYTLCDAPPVTTVNVLPGPSRCDSHATHTQQVRLNSVLQRYDPEVAAANAVGRRPSPSKAAPPGPAAAAAAAKKNAKKEMSLKVRRRTMLGQL